MIVRNIDATPDVLFVSDLQQLKKGKMEKRDE